MIFQRWSEESELFRDLQIAGSGESMACNLLKLVKNQKEENL